jgi:hypothetical protein
MIKLVALSVIGMFFGMLLAFEVGRRIGKYRRARYPEGVAKGGGVEGAVYGLLGLLIALTFAGGVSRFEDRRHLITEEVNAIGTAYLRIDVLSEGAQAEVRQLFRDYLDSRIETYRRLPDLEAAKAELAHSVELQGDIWTKGIAACNESGKQSACMLFLPALNQMIDITTTRLTASQNHPPLIVYLLLGALSLTASVLAGHDMSEFKNRSWLHMVVFTLALSTVVYVIVDIELPRMGLVRVDASDQNLVELRQSMQ